jgi:hypothetical protein
VKILLRLAATAVALAFLLLVLLAILVPRLVQTEAARAKIQSASRSALGRELQYREIDVALMPPSLLVEEPRLAGKGPDGAAPLEARRIALRISLLPLLGGAVVIDSLVVDGAALRFVRTADGVALPLPASPRSRDEKPAAARAGDKGAGGPVALAVRALELRDAEVVLEDRTLHPPVTWVLRDIDVEARGSSLDAPIELEASLELASGGAISARGTAALGGDLDLELEIAGLALAPLQPYAGAEVALEGLLAGAIRVQGPAANPAAISADLTIRDARFTLSDIAVSGAIVARVDVAHAFERPSGSFDLDASAAVLRYSGAFTKPAGTPASVSGRIVADENGALAVDDVTLRIRDFEATGSARVGPPLRVDVRRATADLEGWAALVPALAAQAPSGRLRAEALRFVSQPPGLSGSLHLENLLLKPPEVSAPIAVSGELIARGSEVGSRDLGIVAAGQSVAVDLRLRDLFGAIRYAIDTRVEGADTNALVTAFAGKPDTLQGPLSLQGSYRGVLDPERPLVGGLSGEADLDIEKGRLAGVSLLQASFAQLGSLGSLGSLALDAGRLFGGRDLQRFYGDEFERIQARLRIVDGIVHAEPLALLYSTYDATLTGTLDLADLSLDMQGLLTIYEEVDGSIARHAGAEGYQPTRRSIPLAAVRGSLDAPKVQIAGNSAVEFASGYAKSLYGGQLESVLDKELGKGTGQAIEDALEGIFGGDRR